MWDVCEKESSVFLFLFLIVTKEDLLMNFEEKCEPKQLVICLGICRGNCKSI